MNACIIVPAHNGARYLTGCLKALLDECGSAHELIVVDNGSSDDGADVVARQFPQVQLERVTRPLGFAGAVNYGLRLALVGTAEALLIVNQDTVVYPGWLAAMLAELAHDPQVGVVGCRALFPDGTIQHAGGELRMPLGYGRNRGYGLPAHAPLPHTPPDFLSGVALALRRSMLEQIGLFDEGFNPAYFEDVDLCLRARAAGWRLAYTAAATLMHHEGAAAAGSDYRHSALVERNRVRLQLKHSPLAELHTQFFPAEHAHLRERAAAGSSPVLRRAYLDAILALPQLGRPAAEQASLQQALVGLRRHAALLERWDGAPPPEPEPLSDAPRPAPGTLPPVAIIMLTWNGLAYTRACIESMRAFPAGVAYRLIVIDNGSTDGTREYLRGLADVQLVENPTNVGYVRGNNQGIALAPPGWDVLLLNNDMRVLQSGWLGRLGEVVHSAPDYGIVGCRLLSDDGLLRHAGIYMPDDTFWGWQMGGGEREIGQYRAVREVDGVVGACMYIRREVIDHIGGLDERYFAYYEDSDYCLRARAAGYRIACVGDVSLIHHENVSSKLNNVDFWRLHSASQRSFLERWRDHYAQRYEHRLFWHSLVGAPTGYATSSKQLLVALDRQRVDCRLAYLYGTDFSERSSGDPRVEQMRRRPKDTSLVQVVYNQCDAFHKNSGSYRVGFSMLEVTGIPADWAQQANCMDEVWVPSQFNLETFRSSGVTKPIHVVPLGVDPDYFHPEVTAQRFSAKYTFLSVFEWGERKAPELLLRAYFAAFSARDDVVLVLKTDNRDGDVNVAQQIAALGLPANGPQVVLLYNQELPGYQLGSLYRAADCFVTATRGEGWGMPILEAMACGLPTIATAWSAQTEFMRDDLCYPVRVARLIPAVAKCPYYTGYEWADPDFEHLVERMRYVYTHQESARERGQRAAAVVAREWSWAKAADRIIARLRAIGAA